MIGFQLLIWDVWAIIHSPNWYLLHQISSRVYLLPFLFFPHRNVPCGREWLVVKFCLENKPHSEPWCSCTHETLARALPASLSRHKPSTVFDHSLGLLRFYLMVTLWAEFGFTFDLTSLVSLMAAWRSSFLRLATSLVRVTILSRGNS